MPETRTIDPTFSSRMRAFLPVTVLPNLIVVASSIAFALVALIATSTTMTAMPSVIAQFWLVINLGPVVGRGQELSALPLLPALLLVWAISRRVYRAVKDRVSLADLGVLTLCVLGIPILLTLTACAMLYDASSVFDVDSPPIGEAVLRTGLLHAVALVWGMGRRLWQALCRRFVVPEWFVEASLDAVRALKYIAGGAAIVYSVAFVMHLGDASAIYANYSTAGAIAVSVLSLLYLPNAIVFTAATTVGSQLILGQGSVSLFGVNLVPLPPLPVLAALPHTSQTWAMVALLAPSLGVLLSVMRNVPALKVGVLGGIFAGVYALLTAYFAGGALGVYGYFGPHVWLSAGLTAAWVGGITIMASAVASVLDRGVTRAVDSQQETALGDDPDTDEHESHAAAEDAKFSPNDAEEASVQAMKAATVGVVKHANEADGEDEDTPYDEAAGGHSNDSEEGIVQSDATEFEGATGDANGSEADDSGFDMDGDADSGTETAGFGRGDEGAVEDSAQSSAPYAPGEDTTEEIPNDSEDVGSGIQPHGDRGDEHDAQGQGGADLSDQEEAQGAESENNLDDVVGKASEAGNGESTGESRK